MSSIPRSEVVAAVEYELRPASKSQRYVKPRKVLLDDNSQVWNISVVVSKEKLKPSVKYGQDGLTIEKVIGDVKSDLRLNNIPLVLEENTDSVWLLDWRACAYKPFVDRTVEAIRLKLRPFHGVKVLAIKEEKADEYMPFTSVI